MKWVVYNHMLHFNKSSKLSYFHIVLESILSVRNYPKLNCSARNCLVGKSQVLNGQVTNYTSADWSLYRIVHWRCSWGNGYRRRKWTRRHEFKSWTRLITFHIALIPLGKVWIQLFSLQLWVNSRTDSFLQPWGGN